MEIEVLSRHQSLKHEYKGKFGIISICDPGQEADRSALCHHLARFNNSSAQCVGVLCLDFIDIDVDNLHFIGLFTQHHAGAISMFYHSMLDLEATTLYIHCEVGVARSPAVAAALLLYRGEMELHDALWISPSTYPNSLVYRKLCQELKITVTDEELKELHRRSDAEYRRYIMELEKE